MMKLFRICLTAIAVLFTATLSAQDIKVTGKVTDSLNGESVPGAAIRIKGTMTGVVTDLDGIYTITVPSDGVLVFTSLGYVQKEFPVGGRAVVDIIAEPDTELLDETIVVAFGTSTKEAFTGSATVINSSDISKVQTSEPTRALEGLVAGVQMTTATGTLGASPSIIIRGVSSINASSAPLYVVDGIPYSGDLNNINPSDIESMTVQKDAASSSLYGARGANGVIMITTKKAKGSEAVINVDAKWGLNTRAMKTYDLISDPGQYYEAFYKAVTAYGSSVEGITNEYLLNSYGNKQIREGLQYMVYDVPDGEQLVGVDGKLNPGATLGATVLSPLDGRTYYLLPDNWLDEAYRNSLRQEYNVSVSGRSDAMSIFASFGYLKNQGIIGGSQMHRYTGRLRADYQAKKWLKMGATLSFTNFNWDNGNADEGSAASASNVFGVASSMAPIYPLYVRGEDKQILYDSYGRKRYDYGYYENGAYRPNFTQSNPISDMYLNKNNTEGNAFNVLGFAEASFLKDFKFTFNVGVNVDETRNTTVYNKFYGQFAANGGVIEKSHGRMLDVNIQQLLEWNRTFDGNHHFGLLLGHEWQKSTTVSLGGSKSQMSSADKDELNSAVIDNKTAYSSSGFYNVEGYFARAQYDFSERLFLNASYRLDASSNFSPEHWWGQFWSFGAGWLVNRENWFNMPQFSLLKLKASVGSQGNDGIGSNRYRKTWSLVNYGGQFGSMPGELGNEDITWETNTNLNLGIDYELFSGKLSGSLEYFYRKTSDMLYFFSYPMSTGYSGIYANIGDMRNSGVEFSLSGNILRRKNLSWDAYLNLTHYTNRILSIPVEHKTTSVEGHDGFISGARYVGEGLPLNTFYLKSYAGVETETGLSQWYMDVADASGKVVREKTTDYNKASYYLCGNPTPDMYGGFGTSLSVGGFDMAVAFTYQIGGLAYDSGYATFMASPVYTSLGMNFHKDVLRAWTPDNKESSIPRFQYDDTYTAASSDRFLTSASYLNFQNAQIGYTVPAHLIEKMNVGKLRIYVSCDNIWYVSARKGFDPRFNFSGTSNYAVNSPVRTISGGVNLVF